MSRRVIVIGAGIAGVTAASRLVKSGKFQVTLLEAMPRIGGRIHTEEIEVNGEKDYLEKGAQWAHGESDTTALVMPFGEQYLMNDPIYPLEENWAPKIRKCTNEGVDITDEATLEKFRQMTKTLLAGAEEEDLAENPAISVGEWFLKTIKADSLHDDKAALAWVDFLHRLQIDFDSADTWFETSLRGQLEYQYKPGCTHICWRKGYRSLLNVVLNGSPDDYTIPDWIKLNTPVQNIDYTSNPIRVTTADGKVYETDDVISTVSLGVLKTTHQELFSPQLPKAKVETIENLGFGVVDKIHLQFDDQWWEDGWLGLHTLWTNQEAAKQHFPQWCRSILGFYTYGCPSNVLTAWIHGEEARQAEQLDINEVKQVLIKMLKTFLNRDTIPDFHISMSRWFSNPYTRGSYSFRRPKSEELGVWAKEFTIPVETPGGMLCFAGEATHPNFFSTVHGAYESAIRETDRLLG